MEEETICRIDRGHDHDAAYEECDDFHEEADKYVPDSTRFLVLQALMNFCDPERF